MNRDDDVNAVAEAVDDATLACHDYVLSSEERDNIARYAAAALEPRIVARIAAETEALQGMVEWFAELVVDAREACQRVESIEPMGSPDWVESGIAMRKTVLYEIRKVLDRERNANPSRYDQVRVERDEAREALARVERLHRDDGKGRCVTCLRYTSPMPEPAAYPCATRRAITGEASDDGWMEEAVEHTSRLADKYRKALAPPLTGPWPVKTIDTGEV